MTYIIVNNTHIAELINAVKTMISKQKQQITALMKINKYITILWFEAAAAATESLSICEISTCFIKKIIIRCFNMISENHVWLIAWLIKKITKKNQKIFKKILIIRKLFNENIVIIINTKK